MSHQMSLIALTKGGRVFSVDVGSSLVRTSVNTELLNYPRERS
jgi:hypothetical protein